MADPFAALARLPAGAFGTVTTPGIQQGEIHTYDTSQASFNNGLLTGALAPFQSKYNWPEDLGDGRFAMTFQNPGKHKYDTLRAVYRLDPATGEYVMEGPIQETRQVSSAEQIRDGFEQGIPIVASVLAAGHGLSMLGGAAGAGGNALSAGVGGGGATGGAAAGGSAAGGYGGLTGGGLLTGGAIPTTGGSGLTFAGVGSGAGGVAGVGGYGGVSGAIGAAGAAGAAGGGAGMSSWIPGISNGQTLNLGLNILDGVLGANAARRSANAITDAGNQSNALQREMFDYQRGLNQPLVDMRNSVLPQIQALLANPSSITSQPGYEFGMREGTNALNTGAAARGMTYSGAQGKALQRYGQDYAGTKLDQSLNRLTTAAGLGQVGANNNQTASGNYGAGVGNTLQQMGNVRGSSYMGQANALTGSIGNAFNFLQQQNLLGGP